MPTGRRTDESASRHEFAKVCLWGCPSFPRADLGPVSRFGVSSCPLSQFQRRCWGSSGRGRLYTPLPTGLSCDFYWLLIEYGRSCVGIDRCMFSVISHFVIEFICSLSDISVLSVVLRKLFCYLLVLMEILYLVVMHIYACISVVDNVQCFVSGDFLPKMVLCKPFQYHNNFGRRGNFGRNFFFRFSKNNRTIY